MRDNACVVVMVRAPEKGAVKSRLAADLGPDFTLDLYRLFTEDTLAALRAGPYVTRVFFHPADKGNLVRNWLGRDPSSFPQEGADLGERIKNAFIRTFGDGFKAVAVMASDSPDLPSMIIHETFTALQTADAVLGPALDGGYYLLAFRDSAFLPEALDGIAWGTRDVFRQTLAILTSRGLVVHTLPPWGDLDTVEDLKALLARNAGSKGQLLGTVKYLRDHKEKMP